MTGLLFIHEGMIEKLRRIHALPVKKGFQKKNISGERKKKKKKKKGKLMPKSKRKWYVVCAKATAAMGLE
jgi:hypothetical protein